jgi:hypothetical protein
MSEVRSPLLPLQWKRNHGAPYWRCYTASTPFGSFQVERWREEGNTAKPWGPWKWGYCFDEYHDEYQGECASLEDGKQKAWKEWESRMLPYLRKEPA